MKKFFIFAALFLCLGALSIYAFPVANCISNDTITCFYPFYERSQIREKLSMSPEDFVANKKTYQELAEFMLQNKHGSLEFSSGTGGIVYTTSGSLSETGFLRKYPLEQDAQIAGEKISDVFERLGLESISGSESGMWFFKKVLFLKRGFRQGYVYDKTGNIWKNREALVEDGKLVYYENKADATKRIVRIDEFWYFVTVESLYKEK